MAARRDAEKAAERELQRLDLWGARRDISPIEALGEELERTAGRVTAIEQRLASLSSEQLDSPRGRGLASELNLERGQLQRVAEAAARAGVPERRAAVAQEQGMQIASALRGVLADLELDECQRLAMPDLVRWHLSGISGEPSGPRPLRPSQLQPTALQTAPAQAGPPEAPATRAAPTPADLPGTETRKTNTDDGAQLLELRAVVARRRHERSP